MLIIPELETVVILPPRTASGTIKRAVLERYSDAFMPYRHMEADGVPIGYDRWQKIGVVRHPYDRMWSMYHLLRDGFSHEQLRARAGSVYYEWYLRQHRSTVYRSFEDWLMGNEVVFSTPHLRNSKTPYDPHFAVTNAMPENQKSQHIILRPDLGTMLYEFETELGLLADVLDIDLADRHNDAGQGPRPEFSLDAQDHMQRFHQWDCDYYEIGVVDD